MMHLAHFPAERLDGMNRKQLLELMALLFADSVMREPDVEGARLFPTFFRRLCYWICFFRTILDSTDQIRLIVKLSYEIWCEQGSLSPDAVTAYSESHPD